MLFDIKTVETEARQELAKERGEKAKGRIKAKLTQIAAAEAILKNLRDEYAVLLADIGSE
jgi:hypothetical protein